MPEDKKNSRNESDSKHPHWSRRAVLALGASIAAARVSTGFAAAGDAADSTSADPRPQLPGHWTPTDINRPPVDGPAGQELWQRADKVMPSYRMFLSRSARYSGYNVHPGFIKSADGCRVTDVDGKHYIDFTCSNGPNLLGYRHPEVEAAAQRQLSEGDVMPMFSPAMIEFCERLVAWAPDFSWAVPVKRGSDSTELAVRVARTVTKKNQLVMFERSYHGSNREQSLSYEGVPSTALQYTSRLPWNDEEALYQLLEEQGDDIAAILMSPLDQGPGRATSSASRAFIDAIHAVRNQTGAAIILDDVRAGFRIHPNGSHVAMGLDPDLICLGKALGNGHAVAGLLGKEPMRRGAEDISYTSTFLFGAVGYRAAIATLDIYERDGAFEKIERAGERLITGLEDAGRAEGFDVQFSGPNSHPTISFGNDPGYVLAETFCHEAAKRGALFYPKLNWFVSSAHDDSAIDEAIEIAKQSFQAMSA